MKKIVLVSLFLITFFMRSVYASAQTGILSQIAFDAIKSGAVIEWNTGANVMIVRYSDMECPACINLNSNLAFWPSIQAKYGNLVSHIYKNNRWADHKYTEKKAMAAICIKHIAGNDAYVKFYNTVFHASRVRLYSVNRIPSFLRREHISIPKYMQCMRNPDTLNEFNLETKEANTYSLYGTPGVLFINTQTLRYESLEGFYYMDTFYQKIDALLK